MEIKIFNLKLKNFKGIKELEVVFNGQNTNIYGKNAKYDKGNNEFFLTKRKNMAKEKRNYCYGYRRLFQSSNYS